eukprot:4196945-Alexandrium_andersonii.AAC.1
MRLVRARFHCSHELAPARASGRTKASVRVRWHALMQVRDWSTWVPARVSTVALAHAGARLVHQRSGQHERAGMPQTAFA